MRTIKLIPALCLIAMITALNNSCSKSGSYGSSGGGDPTPTNLVTIQGMQFQPATITVMEGGSVTWKNLDAETHTVTSDDGTSFNSGNISSGGSYTITTPAAGAYPYHCSIHPTEKGTLMVAVKSN